MSCVYATIVAEDSQ